MKLGEQLCKLTPGVYDTRCYRNSFHTKLNHEDQAVFDTHKQEISKHLSKTTKFVPTYKCLSKKGIESSCANLPSDWFQDSRNITFKLGLINSENKIKMRVSNPGSQKKSK